MTEVQIPARHAVLSGNLTIPDSTMALVLFAHGSGSSRHSPRNQFVARTHSIIPGATHLFEEPGALEQAAKLASDWFVDHIGGKTAT